MHGVLAIARCRACADACPVHAIALTNESLSVTAAACRGCGLCRPACPEEAIEIAGASFVPLISSRDNVAYVACEKVEAEGAPGVIPCLQALAKADIERLARENVLRLVTTCGDCEVCMPGSHGRFETLIALTNKVETSRGAGNMIHEPIEPLDWRRRRSAVLASRSDLDQGRRGLFSFILPARSGDGPRDAVATSGTAPGPAIERLYHYVPKIDGERCSGCDACIRICRHGALSLLSSDGVLAYRIDAEACTGCRLCVDICEDGAMSVTAAAASGEPNLALVEARCRGCGAPFHRPAVQGEAPPLCRICQRTDHHRKLHQVRP